MDTLNGIGRHAAEWCRERQQWAQVPVLALREGALVGLEAGERAARTCPAPMQYPAGANAAVAPVSKFIRTCLQQWASIVDRSMVYRPLLDVH